MTIPFVDLDAQYQSIKPEVLKAIEGILDTKDFIQGKSVDTFCKDFNEVHGTKYTVGCANGTSAITVAFRSLNIGHGDEVITVANSFFATPEAIAEVGAIPVFVDCDPETYGIDVKQIESNITKKTKAIVPVHLYGNPSDMDAIMKIAHKHNLKVVEDCAQSVMATLSGKATGTFGDIGTFSFYPGKNLGAYGDAGAVITQSEELKQNLAMQVNHGRTKKYEHDFLAGNFRMDGMQAAILSVKLKYLNDWTNKRIALAKRYDEMLKSSGLKVIKSLPGAKCVYHIYLVELSNRDQVMDHFKEVGIQCGVHYPIPLHMQPALKGLGYKKGDFPVTERCSERMLSLPMYPELTNEMQDVVVRELLKLAKA